MEGTVSTTPGNFPDALAAPMAACRAMTWPLMAGEISLPNSTLKAVSPQERYRTLTRARIAIPNEGVSHGRWNQRWLRQHQLGPGREFRPVGHGQRRRGAEDREVGQRGVRLPRQRSHGDGRHGEALQGQ